MSSNLVERIELTRERLDNIEKQIQFQRHVERYGLVRKWCKGKVIDFACGCGYGTHLISVNPEVEEVVGYDGNKDAIRFAEHQYSGRKKRFVVKHVTSEEVENGDTLVCLETIEHIKDPADFVLFVRRVDPRFFIVSFPTKKTTHYNPHHFHDFTETDIIYLFRKWYHVEESVDLFSECCVIKFERHENGN